MGLPIKNKQPETIASPSKRKSQSSFRRWIKLLMQSKTGTVGLFIVLSVFLVAVFAPWIAPHNPSENNLASMLQPPFWMEGGSTDHILGTDNLGRDIFSRIVYGAQVSLLVGITAVLIAGAIGLVAGIVAGYYGGFIDNVIMRFVDAFLAIPSILMTLVILGIVGPGMLTLILVLGITNWVNYARIVRGEVLSVKERDFVKAANMMGVNDKTIMYRHLAPNIFSSFIVISTLSVATTIISEAALSFLGMGIQPPQISWGSMLSTGRDYLADSWWVATFPGIAITITTLGIIFLGDWLRDVLDPKTNIGRKGG
ncbi:ABC transporter permease [Alteribacillus bidgolensis]|uniref:Peptide/nickel transport system permease protein n=1 Tax=Alteribacillus bidgolensis TaxID=930129 RepID=A0A1G8K775_9BACI|nr:ABC transporter permease [Alteribacillus bidgolensis]SDI39282.1 peptide/nickel transport system permease protein [Alteribacillus bidgolensis]